MMTTAKAARFFTWIQMLNFPHETVLAQADHELQVC